MEDTKVYFKYIAGMLAGMLVLWFLYQIVAGAKAQAEKFRDETSGTAPVEEIYNGDGLLEGTELSGEILFEDEAFRVYPDRVLAKLRLRETAVPDTVSVLRALRSLLDRSDLAGVNMKVVPIPPSILLEENAEAENRGFQELLAGIAEGAPEGFTVVDLSGSVAEGRDEFIYYRTQECWTLVGAYYGYRGLCDALGISPLPRDRFVLKDENSFYGQEYSDFLHYEAAGQEVKDRAAASMPADPFVFLMSDTFLNRETQYRADVEEPVKRPVILHSVMGATSVVGSTYDYTVVEGTGEGGILVLCDHEGNMTAPYLSEHYRYVVVANLTGFTEFPSALNELIGSYEIRDAVLLQRADHLGERGYTKALNAITE